MLFISRSLGSGIYYQGYILVFKQGRKWNNEICDNLPLFIFTHRNLYIIIQDGNA